MNSLFSAFRFITVLPLGGPDRFDASGMIPFFPIVGIFLGLGLGFFDLAASVFWPGEIVALLDVIFLAAVTGAFHLDGLGDTADGLYGHHTRERALEIMKDSRIGAMALVTVLCVFALKWISIAHIGPDRFIMLLIIPAFARGSMLLGFRFLDYGRSGGGTGHAFFEEKLPLKAFRGLAPAICLSLLAGWRGLLIQLAFCVIGGALVLYYKRRMGCVTGDMLGAMTEITEAGLFLAAAAGGAA